MNENDIVISQD